MSRAGPNQTGPSRAELGGEDPVPDSVPAVLRPGPSRGLRREVPGPPPLTPSFPPRRPCSGPGCSGGSRRRWSGWCMWERCQVSGGWVAWPAEPGPEPGAGLGRRCQPSARLRSPWKASLPFTATTGPLLSAGSLCAPRFRGKKGGKQFHIGTWVEKARTWIW